jgi:Spy/CpxP family protein refolding chaperone
MKKIAVLIVAVLLATGLSAEAQSNMNQGSMRNMHNQSGMMMQGNRTGNYGMMSGEMMGQGMMNGNYSHMMGGTLPMWRYERMVAMLPRMQSQLSLTSDQTEKLIDLKSAYQKKEIDLSALQQKRQLQLQSLLQSNASAEAVRKQLQSCTDVSIDMGVEAYKTVQQMESVLNNSQQKEFQSWMMNSMQNNNMNGHGMGKGMMNN